MRMGTRRWISPVAVAALTAAAACKDDPPAPKEVQVTVRSHDLALAGAIVVGEGQRRALAVWPWETGKSIVGATLTLPPGAEIDPSQLSLELPTPCGPEALGALPVEKSQKTFSGADV
jgi:hypothetical protein